MTSRRRLVVGLLVLAAVALVAGRFVAAEIAERLWVLSTDAGPEPLRFRRLAIWSRLAWTATAIIWFVGHLTLLYRAVGGVQVPRKIGNLEIAEALPRDALLALLVGVGVVLGLVVSSGGGAWWLAALLAREDVRFGIADPLLGRDAGFYLAQLPWRLTLQRFAWRLVLPAVLLLPPLYLGIGAIRVSERRIFMTDGARRHLAGLATLTVLVLAWGWTADAMAVVAGLEGERALATAQARILASMILPAVALATATATAVGIFSRRGFLPLAGWGVLAAAWVAMRGLLPLTGERATVLRPAELVRAAYGLTGVVRDSLVLNAGDSSRFDSLRDPLRGIPVWHREMIRVRYRTLEEGSLQYRLSSVGLVAGAHDTDPTWRGIATPDPSALAQTGGGAVLWRVPFATTGPVLEFDPATGDISRTHPGGYWFSTGLTWFAVANSGPPGVPLRSFGTRLAFAWRLQSTEIFGARGWLLWRRPPEERLHHLAPFAEFRDPSLVLAEGRLVWVLDGYVTARGFPGAPAQPWSDDGDEVRYARASFIGTVDAEHGGAALYLAPEADPVGRAWARLAGGLVRPPGALPDEVRRALHYPATLLRLQTRTLVGRSPGETLPPADDPTDRDPIWALITLAPDTVPRLWAFLPLTGANRQEYQAIVAGTRVEGEKRLAVLTLSGETTVPRWTTVGPDSLTGPVVAWPVHGALYTQQALYAQGPGEPELRLVRVTWGSHTGVGFSRETALDDLVAPSPSPEGVPDAWGRLLRAQAIIRQADSLLTSGDLVGFARAFDELRQLLAPPEVPR